MPEYRYYKGRPQAHRDLQLAALANLCGCCGCLTLVVLAVNYLGLIFVPSIFTVFLTIVANVLFGFWVWPIPSHVRFIRRDRGSITPYFTKPTDGSLGDAWLSGQALSRNCEILDGLAIRLGVRPLSSFGFLDDMRGEEVIWHEPKDGIETVQAILRELESMEVTSERDAVRADLEKLRTALGKAQANGNKFALLVQFEENWISSIEVEQRKGSYY